MHTYIVKCMYVKYEHIYRNIIIIHRWIYSHETIQKIQIAIAIIENATCINRFDWMQATIAKESESVQNYYHIVKSISRRDLGLCIQNALYQPPFKVQTTKLRLHWIHIFIINDTYLHKYTGGYVIIMHNNPCK